MIALQLILFCTLFTLTLIWIVGAAVVAGIAVLLF